MAKTTKGRLHIPKSTGDMLRLADKVYKKHEADKGASLLNNIDGLDWTKNGPNIALALQKHDEAETLKGQMEEAYRMRDLYADGIAASLRQSGSGLKGMFPNNPKKLAEWGFSVDDTPPAKKKKPNA